MYTIRKLFKFEMSHRLMSSFSGCCQNIHGHSYKLEVFLSINGLNKDGMVMDFGELKEIMNPLIDYWDHSIMLHSKDRLINKLCSHTSKIVAVEYNPTAENMCRHAYEFLETELIEKDKTNKYSCYTIKIRIHETDTGWAEYTK